MAKDFRKTITNYLIDFFLQRFSCCSNAIRNAIIIILCICVFILYILTTQWKSPTLGFGKPSELEIQIKKSQSSENNNYIRNNSRYVIDTTSCRIPNFDPRDHEVKHMVEDNMKMFSCGNPSLTSLVDRMLIINSENIHFYGAKKIEDIECCYKVVKRSGEGHSDNKFELSESCTDIKNGTVVNDEFIRVECSIVNSNKSVVQYHFSIPLLETYRDSNSDIFSVMTLGLDSTSRLNFQRHMPKTRDFLLSKMEAVEMFGYTKVGDNTLPNLSAVLGGLSLDEINGCYEKADSYDNCNLIWKTFKNYDYATLYGEDITFMSTFNYLANGFYHEPTDYYLRPFLKAAENETASNNHWNTLLCLGPTPMHEVILNWAKEFMKTMVNNPYFGFIWTNSLTHDELNYLQWADNYFLDMLNELYYNGYLDRVILLIMSDHGMRWGSIRETTIGRYENRLPALYVHLPKLFREQFPDSYKNLVDNSRRLTGPFDVHSTFLDIVQLQSNLVDVFSDVDKGSAAGISILKKIPINRTCKDTHIDHEWCACDEEVDVDVDDEIVWSISRYIVQTINNVTSEIRDKCQELVLRTVINAKRLVDVKTRDKKTNAVLYRVVIDVEPSEGIFESTVFYNEDTHTISITEEEIIRMNLYGNQSSCVHERAFKDFCYCF